MPTMNTGFRYVWFIWASAFLLPWIGLFVARPVLRWSMLWSSVLTTPFGLTQLLFVPRYWDPPSLFDLAYRTGFDIESLIFCFAIGGLAVSAYRVLTPVAEHILQPKDRTARRHRWHLAALVSPFFVLLILLRFPLNPIYPGIVALFAGALTSCLCRPDLWRNALVGGIVFLSLYVVFLVGLKMLWPGYIEAVWNLGNLIAWRPGGLPLEELLFGFGFGMYWSSVYEHITWRQRDASPHRSTNSITDVLPRIGR